MKKVLSFALSMAIALSAFNFSVQAESTAEGNSTVSYEDYEPGDMPANFFLRPTDINSFTGNNNEAGKRLDYVVGDKFIPIREKIIDADARLAAGPIMVMGSNNLSSGLVGGKNYVLSVTMKNLTPEIREEQIFAIMVGQYKTPHRIPFSNTEYKTYNTVFTAEAEAKSIHLGLDATIDRSGYTEAELGTIHISIESGSEMYLAEETAYDMTISGDANVIETEGSANFKAELLNQLGIKGKLGQEFEWVVLNADRTQEINEGFTITKNDDGINLAVSKSASPGEYVVFAKSCVDPKIKKGTKITVTKKFTYDDYIPGEITDNMVKKPENVNTFTPNNGAAGTLFYDKNDMSYFKWTEKITGIQFYKAGPTVMNESYLNKTIEKNKRYVFSARLKNSSPTVKRSIDFALGLYGASVPEFKFPVENTEYETFNKTFVASRNGTSISIGFDGTIDRSAYTEDQLGSIMIDLSNGGSLYIAEEKPYEIVNNILGADEIIPGGTTTLRAEILNQVGLKYEDNQNISWVAMNENCTEVIDDITITPQGNGQVLVETSDDIAYGTYKIAAVANSYGWVKKATVTVVDSVDERISDFSLVKLGNEIVLNAKVKDTDSSKVYFRLAEFSGKNLVKLNTTPIDVIDGDAVGRVSLGGVSNANTIKAFIWGDDMKPIDNLYNHPTVYSVRQLDSVYGDDQAIDLFDAPEVCTFYNNKKAAVSVTFDDGNYNAAVYYDSLFQKYNMHGTAMVVSDWLKDIPAWQTLLDKGTIDIGNHSKGHAIKYNEDEYSKEELEADITGAYNALRQYFPDEKLIVFATPWCRYTAEVGEEILKTQYANRTGGGGFLSSNPTDAEMMKIPSYIVQSDQSVETLNANIDKAIADGSWYSLLMHGVNETAPEDKNNNINKDVCDAHFRYIGSKEDVWAGSMTEVIQYIKERNSATITINWIRENAMSITLTDTLDNNRFDFPLTYKVNVPNHWEDVTVTQNYQRAEVTTFKEGDKTYAYINIVPDKGDITLESSN